MFDVKQTKCGVFADLQRDVVGHSLGFDEVFWLMLRYDVPANGAIDTVLEEDGPVHCIRLIQSSVTAVCLRHAAYLQHEHDLTGRDETSGQDGDRMQEQNHLNRVKTSHPTNTTWHESGPEAW